MRCFIYALIDPVTAEVRYIGKTINPKVRLALHLCETKNTHKNQWLAKLRRAGVKPLMSIIEVIENSNDLDWQDRERFWIAHYLANGVRLTNLDSGGRQGMRKSAQTRELIRQKATGRVMPKEAIEKSRATRAANMNDEVRARLSRAQLGKKQSEETVAKRAAILKGHVVTEETRRKIGSANKISRERYLASHPPKCRQPKIPKIRQPVSSETRAKQRAAKIGRPMSLQAHASCLVVAESRRGVKCSPEICARISAGKRLGWALKKQRNSLVLN